MAGTAASSGTGTLREPSSPVSELNLGPLPSAVPCARGHTRNALHEWGIGGDVADAAELVVSELVTNAVQAAQRLGAEVSSAIRLQLSNHRAHVLIEVGDSHAEMPEPQRPDPDLDHGRGLLLIAALSAEWGCYPGPRTSGKVVWAKVAK